MLKNVPNILTIFRLFLIPFIVISVLTSNFAVAIIIFTISAFTDILDGFIAKKFNFITDLGKLLDPLADKLTQISILLSLTILKIIPIWILIIVFIKEAFLVTGASFLYSKKDVVVYSKWYGKLATVLFYLAIICSLIITQFDINLNFRIDMYLYYLAILSTVFATIMYIKNFRPNLSFENK